MCAEGAGLLGDCGQVVLVLMWVGRICMGDCANCLSGITMFSMQLMYVKECPVMY